MERYWLRWRFVVTAATIVFFSAGGFAADDASSVSELIDAEIGAALQKQSLKAAPQAEPTDLVRRIYLDVLGRIPTRAETEAFLADLDDEKHHRLIDELLAHEEMAVYWASVVDHWLNGGMLERDFGQEAFLRYLENTLRDNRPWNEIARGLLVPDPSSDEQRGAAYFLALRLRTGDNAERLDNMTSAVSTGFFGIQLQCAKCHDHPFVPSLKQDHYYGLAAFLGRTQEARVKDFSVLREKADGEVTFVTTKKEEKTAQLLFLDGTVLPEPSRPEDKNDWYVKGIDGLPDVPHFSRRAALADHALQPSSPYFKRAIVNRLWKQLMGQGLVEPVDQMHEANPATHPQLLERLAEDLATNDFDLRRMLAGILHSETYLRSTRWSDSAKRPPTTSYAVATLKPLTPLQLVTSVSVATGTYAQFQVKLEREAKEKKGDPVTPAVVRRRFAREREFQEFATLFRGPSDSFEPGAAQALFLTYSQAFVKQLKPGNGNLTERLIKGKDSPAQELFLTILSRPPSDEESRRVETLLANAEGSRDAQCQELVWSLLCGAEFRFNR